VSGTVVLTAHDVADVFATVWVTPHVVAALSGTGARTAHDVGVESVTVVSGDAW
jgi:hypothetical protein